MKKYLKRGDRVYTYKSKRAKKGKVFLNALQLVLFKEYLKWRDSDRKQKARLAKLYFKNTLPKSIKPEDIEIEFFSI